MEKINYVEIDKNGNHLIRLVGDGQEHRINLMSASEIMYKACEAVDNYLNAAYPENLKKKKIMYELVEQALAEARKDK